MLVILQYRGKSNFLVTRALRVPNSGVKLPICVAVLQGNDWCIAEEWKNHTTTFIFLINVSLGSSQIAQIRSLNGIPQKQEGDFFSSAVEQGSVLGLGEKLLGSSVPCVSLKDFTEVEPWQHPAQWHPLWSAACPAVLAALRFGSGQARGREPGLCRARCRHRFPRGVPPSPSWCSATVCSTLLLREHQNTGHLCT